MSAATDTAGGDGRWPAGEESVGKRAEDRGGAGCVRSDWPGPGLDPEVRGPENAH